jgi:hypothetical protein
LWGDKNFHNGNYVVFVTHSYHDEASWLLGTYTKFTKEVVNDLKINSKDNSLLRAIESMSDSDYWENIDIGFVVLVEQDIKVDWDANRPNYPYEEDKPCDPYSSWTDEDHELNDNHKAGTYVRNDGDATAYRTLMSEISKVFSGGSNISNDFFGMQWVKGYPITDTMVSSDNISSCFNFLTWLRTNYEKGTDWK